MADHHQLIDQIRAFVQSSDQTLTPQLEALAREYAEACVAVNTRLSRCQRLLQQGLRSEAIQFAESEPKLLDVIAALDFPERPEWNEITSVYGLPSAPPISIETAGFLNEAYALEDPLQELLRTHRRLALLRAPLVDRIAVLRKLAAQDSANPIWSDDQRTFEKVRFRQIQAEVADAAKRQDVAGVSRLLSELDHSLWVEPPPPSLVQGVRKTDAQLRGRQTRAALAEIEGELNDAFSTRDAYRAREARRRWQALIDREKIPANDPLQIRVAPIFAWLRDEDHREEDDRGHDAAQRELLSALDATGRIGPAELERLGNEVLRFERGMSDAIRAQFLDRLRREREFAAVKNKRIMAAAAVAACVVIGSGVYMMRRHARLGDAARAATALADMVELGEIENATDFLKKLTEADASLLETPTLVEARTKFQAAQEKEVARQLKFDEAMREAEHADLAVVNPPSLETARSLARLETEKKGIELLTKRRAAQLATEQSRQDQVLTPKLGEIDRKLGAIQQVLGRSVFDEAEQEPLTQQIAEAQAALNALAQGVRLAGADVQSRSTALSARLEAARGKLERRRAMSRIERDLTASLEDPNHQAGSFERFARLMADYAKTYPEEPRGRAFSTMVKEKPIWDAIAAWEALVAAWKTEEKRLTLARAKDRADQCVAFLASHPGFPQIETPTEYRAYLEAIVRRDGAEGSPRKRLVLLLSDLLVDQIWMIKYKDPQAGDYRFYLSKPPQENKNLISYLVGFDGKERVRSIVKQFITSSDWSPQTKIARKFKPTLTDNTIVTGWDETMLNLISTICAEPDIDPLLQIALLRKVCEYAADGSPPLARALEPISRRLKDGDVDVNVPWMDPGSSDADRSRPRAKLILDSLKAEEIAKVRAQLKTLQAGAEDRVLQSIRVVGWLRWDEASWSVQTPSPIRENAELWVAVPRPGGKSAWEKAGAVKGGTIQILGLSQTTLAEGRPVFIRQGGTERGS